MPDSDRLTISTWLAWSSILRLRWRTPIPPFRAMATAMVASVTVSMAAESTGDFMVMFLVRWVVVSTSEGTTSDSLGNRSTSS